MQNQPTVQNPSQPVEPTVVQNDELVGETYEETFMRQVDNLGPKRQCSVRNRFHPDSCNLIEFLTNDISEPKTVKEALQSEHSVEWRSVMSAEFKSLTKNNTWELVPPPEKQNIVGSKWVLKVKRNSGSSLDRFKARLVAQGYTQTSGSDYKEVFALVAKYSTIRSLLTLANAQNLEVHQLDIKTAFLNGSVEHDIYMFQPEGFIDPNRQNYVCKLNKSIYGVKQSRCWKSTLDEFLTSSGYRRSAADECIYIKQIKNSNGKISFVTLAVYVDDMLPVSNDIDFLNAEKKSLCDHFEMTDQGRFTISWGCPLRETGKTVLCTSVSRIMLRAF